MLLLADEDNDDVIEKCIIYTIYTIYVCNNL